MARTNPEVRRRWALLRELQAHYADFKTFLHDGMEFLGFNTSELQYDIADYVSNGPLSAMVQAQRGQAKTTIAALYAIWCLIHWPFLRILIVSAGGTQANEISTLIVRVIGNWDVLECLRPDKQEGDRTSVERFDVHWALKGVDKSPSVACVGITANLPGKRADLLIADDVESTKNALTALMRAQLLHLTLEFTNICTGREEFPAKILWLGTPQSVDSIYNTLPARGIAVRIWPGRYPTPEQRQHYGAFLAPKIAMALDADPSLGTGGGPLGDQGQPTDPSFIGEEKLLRKEQEQGTAQFQLQQMLNTRLTDALRYPLKPERVVTMTIDKSRRVPLMVVPGNTPMHLRPAAYETFSFKVNTPASTDGGYTVLPRLHMYVDPAPGGLNNDETGYAISGCVGSTIFVVAAGGIRGGYGLDRLLELATVAEEWGVEVVTIEKNLGFGAFREVWTPILRGKLPTVAIEDDYVTVQKELRICGTLEPIIGRGSLVLNTDILGTDWETARSYHGPQHGVHYTLMHQLAKMQRIRGACIHDDRVDALEGTCRYWQQLLQRNQEDSAKAAEQDAWKRLTQDPLGYNRYKKVHQARSAFERRVGALGRYARK